MHILVLDTIHGGKPLCKAFAARGDTVDLVDVYHTKSAVDIPTALGRNYELIVSPVHLDPDHPLLNFSTAPVITHHEAVRELLGEDLPQLMIEVTGARGKTTTAHALASLLPGKGILHTSAGTFQYPEKNRISRSSITPASVLDAASLALGIHGWLIAEESLGVTGAGTLAIITSDEDYLFAAGKKSAVAAKTASAQQARRLLLAEHIRADYKDGRVHIEDVAACEGDTCRITMDGKTTLFKNPLLALPAYRASLMLAAAAAQMLGFDPAPLSQFAGLTGRMSLSYVNDTLVVDNANSGTNLITTVQAADYARITSGREEITLVIGQAEDDGAVCEGFAPDRIRATIDQVRPDHVVWVGLFPMPGTDEYALLAPVITAHATTLNEGYTAALKKTGKGSIVLAVKTWR